MAAMTRTLFFGSCFTAALASSSSSAPQPRHFLGSRAGHLSAAGLNTHSTKDLLKEIETVAGADHRMATEARVERLEKALQPMFAAMPKNSQNLVEAAGVRYLMHRLFVQRHGWFVNGLDTNGGSWDSASPAEVFKGHAEDHHELFNSKLGNGFSLRQVAVFAATLETLVHSESLERLEAAYRVLGFMKNEQLSDQESQEAISAYMLMYVQGTNLTSVDAREYKSMNRTATEAYPTWPETKEFVQGVRERIMEDTEVDERNSWRTSLKVVEEVAERYGRWQDKECHQLKQVLVGMEQPGTGRVRLQDFYGKSLQDGGNWQFIENVPYLRQLGALDESNPEQMSVIIPNYINSPANCVASSKFYAVCCIDECESLLGHLENKIAAPDATPERIVELVSALTSDTQKSARTLSDSLIQKLREIATHHGGRVPLHGRLFAQWMHHAYPRECQFPHLAGTTKPQTQEEWIQSTDMPIQIGEDEIRELLRKSEEKEAASKTSVQTELPWSQQEELFIPSQASTTSSSSSGVSGTLMTMAAFGLAAIAFLTRSYGNDIPMKKPCKDVVTDRDNHKYYV